jgi:hypothetical protein
MSDDGANVVAGATGGMIYKSADFGTTWSEDANAEVRNWSGVACNSDCSKVVAVVSDGWVYSGEYGTYAPSDAPSGVPSSEASGAPSSVPSSMPSIALSDVPSATPSNTPSNTLSSSPSSTPSQSPSNTPANTPSSTPSNPPSNPPSTSNTPSAAPSVIADNQQIVNEKDFDCLCGAMFGKSIRTEAIDLEYPTYLTGGMEATTCGGALAGKASKHVLGGFDYLLDAGTTCAAVAAKLEEFEPFCGQQTNGDTSSPLYWDITMKDASTNNCATNEDKFSCESNTYTVEAPCEVLFAQTCQYQDDGYGCGMQKGDYDLNAWMTANDGVDIIGTPQTCWDAPSDDCWSGNADFFGGDICSFGRPSYEGWSGEICFDNTLVTTEEEKTACTAKAKSKVSFHPIGTSCLFGR